MRFAWHDVRDERGDGFGPAGRTETRDSNGLHRQTGGRERSGDGVGQVGLEGEGDGDE
jgi:hypothetical protein